MKKKKILPPTYFMISLAAIAFIHLILSILQFIPFPFKLYGILLILLGSYFNLAANKDFKEFKTTVKPFEYSTKLITNGIFSFIKHPMYLVMTLILVGESMLFGSFSPLFIVIIFSLLVHKIFIRVEEEMLLEEFGMEYINYKNKVRSWI